MVNALFLLRPLTLSLPPLLFELHYYSCWNYRETQREAVLRSALQLQTNLKLKPIILHEGDFSMQFELVDLPKLSTCRVNWRSVGWNACACVCVYSRCEGRSWNMGKSISIHSLRDFHFITLFHIPHKPNSHTQGKYILISKVQQCPCHLYV